MDSKLNETSMCFIPYQQTLLRFIIYVSKNKQSDCCRVHCTILLYRISMRLWKYLRKIKQDSYWVEHNSKSKICILYFRLSIEIQFVQLTLIRFIELFFSLIFFYSFLNSGKKVSIYLLEIVDWFNKINLHKKPFHEQRKLMTTNMRIRHRYSSNDD